MLKKLPQGLVEIVGILPLEVWSPGKQPKLVLARSLLCYWATSQLGTTQAWLSKKLGLSQAAVSLSVARGRKVIKEQNYNLGSL
jgi:putative transposase